MESKQLRSVNQMSVTVLAAAKVRDYIVYLVSYKEDDWTSEPTVVFSHTKTNDLRIGWKAVEDHITYVGSTQAVTLHGGFRHALLETEAQLQAISRSIDYESCYYNLMALYKEAERNPNKHLPCALKPPSGVMAMLRTLVNKLKLTWGKPKPRPTGDLSDAATQCSDHL
jgi:hypothetical protein